MSLRMYQVNVEGKCIFYGLNHFDDVSVFYLKVEFHEFTDQLLLTPCGLLKVGQWISKSGALKQKLFMELKNVL